MMKNVKIKSTNKFSLFQKFDEKLENIKSNSKKKMLTKKLTNIIKNNAQLNKLMKISNLKMKKMKMSKKIEISEFVQRFYAVEISKTIVSLTEKHVKVLLNNEIEICFFFSSLSVCNLKDYDTV